jgi:hypothetical protein
MKFLSVLDPFKNYLIAGVVVGLILFVSIHLINDSHIVMQRDSAIRDLKEYKLQQDNLVAQLKLENANNMKDAEKLLSDSKATTSKQIEIIEASSNKKVNKITNEIRGNYETKLAQLNIDSSDNSLRDTTTSNSAAEAEATSNQGLAGSESVTDTACIGLRAEKEQLEEACAVETVYFNMCRTALDADTLLYGREEN